MGEEAAFDAVAIAGTQRMKDELPEQEKKGNVGKILDRIDDLLQTGISFHNTLQHVDELSALGRLIARVEKMLQEPECGKEKILEAIDFQKKNASQALIDSYCGHFFNTMSIEELHQGVEQDTITEHEDTKELILNSLKSYEQDRSNELATNMVKKSAAVAAYQAMKIFRVWKAITNASNLIMDNPNEFDAINRNIEWMKQMVIEVLGLCERNPRDSRIGEQMIIINTECTSILDEISNLKAEINGQIQSLDLLADYSAIDGVVNSVTAVAHGFQLWQTWANLTSYAKFLLSAMTAVFTGFAVANFTQFYLSQNTLKDLRKDLREVIRLQKVLRDQHNRAKQALRARYQSNQDFVEQERGHGDQI